TAYRTRSKQAWCDHHITEILHRRRRGQGSNWAIFDVPETVEPGLDAVAHVQANIDEFARRWRDAYPAAVRILLTDRDSLTHYLRTPREHWSRVRHSNFIERTFGKTRRRVEVIGRLPGETSCISLIWAVLDRASRGWRGFTMTPPGSGCSKREEHYVRSLHR
ncbi:MAG: transposase, partial [Pseudonocardiaceae bacterium]